MGVLEQERIAEREFCVDVPFEVKSADGSKSGDLSLKGLASTWMEDRDGETVDRHAFDEDLPTYMSTNPILLWQHSQEMPLGQVTTAQVSDAGLAVKAFVPKPTTGMSAWKFDAYNDIKRGVVRTFSIGGLMQRELRWPANGDGTPNYDVDPKIFIPRVMLLEISCVSIPANPGSLYEAAVKSIKGAGVGPVLTDNVKEQMAQLLGMKAVTDEALKAMSDDERERHFAALSRLYQRCGLVAPERDSWKRAAGVMEKATSANTILMATIPPLMLTLGMVKTGRGGNVSEQDREEARHVSIDRVAAALKGEKFDDDSATDPSEKMAQIDAIKQLGLAIAGLGTDTGGTDG
jgi:HK97 family phage prohead protease